jgi:hypothetical protein
MGIAREEPIDGFPVLPGGLRAPGALMPAAATTWIVRYVDKGGLLRVRTCYTEEAAVLFIG